MSYTKTLTVDEVILALQALSSAGHGNAEVIMRSPCCASEAGEVVAPGDHCEETTGVVMYPTKYIPDGN